MNSHARRPLALFLTAVLCLSLIGALAGPTAPRTLADTVAELGPAPVYSGQDLPPSEFAAAGTGPTVDLSTRAAAAAFYQSHYLGPGSPAITWTGTYDPCNPGATAAAFRTAVLQRIQYYRAMAGVPADISFSSTLNAKDQQAALMMGKAGQLDHTPQAPWPCYSAAGYEAAGASNLALGRNGWEAINLYVWDFGAGNSSVGHRRWLLYPQTTAFGTGDVADSDGGGPFRSANALWVFNNLGDSRPPTRDGFVAWPPKGYVPYQVVYPRWSFSYPGADFSGATVTVTSFGNAIPVTREDIYPAPGSGLIVGEPTIVWRLNNQNSADGPTAVGRDTRYQVRVNNVVVNGTARNFRYDVVIFDPNSTPPPAPSCTLVPSSGIVGRTLKVRCINFEPRETVDLYWGDPVGTAAAAYVSDTSGAGFDTFKIPPSTAGSHRVSARGRNSRTVVALNFTTTPRMLLSPSTRAKGLTVRVTLTGFKAGESITIAMLNSSGVPTRTLKSGVIASSVGSASTSFVVPVSGTGPRTIRALGNGGTVTTTPLTLVPAASAASVPESTATTVPTATPRPTRTPRPTHTPQTTADPTSTPEPQPTETPVPTETPDPEPTATETPAPEPTATDTPEPTPTETLQSEPEPEETAIEGETGP